MTFTHDEAARLLDVDREFIRSQAAVKTGLIYDARRTRGSGVTADELLALAVLQYVQSIVGRTSPAAHPIVSRLRSFLQGVLADPARSIPDVDVPFALAGGGSFTVRLRLPMLPGQLRDRIAALRAGKLNDVGMIPRDLKLDGVLA